MAKLTRESLMTLEAYAEHGDYAATTASGFESTVIGVRLLWRAGLRGN